MKHGMQPDRVLITCEALGLHHVQATQSSSSHVVIYLLARAQAERRSEHTSGAIMIGHQLFELGA